MKSKIQKQLIELAYQKTTPFCYGCYIKAPQGVCPLCKSDDLMRHLEGVGVEYGTDWVIEDILDNKLNEVDTESVFTESIKGQYPEETEVGFMRINTIQAMKDSDPAWWDMEKEDHISGLEENDEIMSFNGGKTYYWIHDLKKLLKDELD